MQLKHSNPTFFALSISCKTRYRMSKSNPPYFANLSCPEHIWRGDENSLTINIISKLNLLDIFFRSKSSSFLGNESDLPWMVLGGNTLDYGISVNLHCQMSLQQLYTMMTTKMMIMKDISIAKHGINRQPMAPLAFTLNGCVWFGLLLMF